MAAQGAVLFRRGQYAVVAGGIAYRGSNPDVGALLAALGSDRLPACRIGQIGGGLDRIGRHQPVGSAPPRQAGKTVQRLEIGNFKDWSWNHRMDSRIVIFPNRQPVGIQILV